MQPNKAKTTIATTTKTRKPQDTRERAIKGVVKQHKEQPDSDLMSVRWKLQKIFLEGDTFLTSSNFVIAKGLLRRILKIDTITVEQLTKSRIANVIKKILHGNTLSSISDTHHRQLESIKDIIEEILSKWKATIYCL